MTRLGRGIAVVVAATLACGLSAEAGAAAPVGSAPLPDSQVSATAQAAPRPVCLKIAPSKNPKKPTKSRTYGKRKTGCKKGLLRTVVPAA